MADDASNAATDVTDGTGPVDPEPSAEVDAPQEPGAGTGEGQDAAAGAEDSAPAPSAPTGAPKRTRSRAKKPARKAKAKAAARPKRDLAAARAAKFPRHSVERALRIPTAIYEQNGGQPASLQEAVRFTGGDAVSGSFRTEVSSGKKYGFLEAADGGKVGLTDRARRAIAPQSPTDQISALQEAVLAAPDMAAVYSFYRGENLPDPQFFVNALTDRFAIPADKVGEFQTIFDESVKSAELVDDSGDRPRLIDVGRDEQHRSKATSTGAGNSRALQAGKRTGGSCFVMQPFAGALGSYYETIYRPAIEQAGLQPQRADDEIFGTGKIMDQVWRGIRAAEVLVAELTSKNANVFYELGLAHALEKPVVLVSSNQDDVPFDLRHIRVILYDQSDPFWGQKLIDKLADNIRSAVDNPEEAIFRVTED